MATNRFCVDCKHYVWVKNSVDLCGRNQPVSLVTGEPKPTHKVTCEDARRLDGSCRPEGHYFVARNTSPAACASKNKSDTGLQAGIFILCGPQGIGKTQRAQELAKLLSCDYLVDCWDGVDPLRSGTLAVTNAIYNMPEGAVAFRVEDAAGLDSLIRLLSTSAP